MKRSDFERSTVKGLSSFSLLHISLGCSIGKLYFVICGPIELIIVILQNNSSDNKGEGYEEVPLVEALNGYLPPEGALGKSLL